ncbi:MAG: acyloxyacyl hydrolase [Muribaculaceae bacterium]|nr:acyloxyacyl hydrolase [Muribaculaceae bacterium]
MSRFVASLILLLAAVAPAVASDTVPSGFSRRAEWRVGAEVSPEWVIPTNGFLRGENAEEKKISAAFAGDIRAGFRFAPSTREGMLYKGLYQGIGLGVCTYFAGNLLGTPVSAYAFQGAPIVHLGKKAWLGYEWQFGAAFGWKHFDDQTPNNNAAVSTAVTAHMGVGLKFHYSLSEKWQVSAGVLAKHYSNGNTSWPNAGVNSVGITIGVDYAIDPKPEESAVADNAIVEEADKARWNYDIIVYGAWRKRIVSVGDPSEPTLCLGKFGVLGMQFAPMRQLNRWVAVGPSLDLQWDESAGIAPYHVAGTYGNFIRFRRPPFAKQISVGLSAHAELTMPIFTVNGGVGYQVINPKGDRAFYQSLTLKTFVCRNVYLNVGYSLGRFKDPKNLMLGIGVRF